MAEEAKELTQEQKLAKAEEFKAKFARGELADGTVVKLNTRVEPDRKAEMEDRLAKIAALRKIGWDREEKARADYLKRREREKAEEVEKKVEAEAKIKSAADELLRNKSEEEPKAKDTEEPKVNEEEALKAEAPVPVTDLNPEEQKKRRLIRFVKPWASGPTTLLNDAKHKVPRCRDLSFRELSDFLLEWGCHKTAGDDRYYHFPPLVEIRAIWDRRYAPREWSPCKDWGHAVKPDLTVLLNEKL